MAPTSSRAGIRSCRPLVSASTPCGSPYGVSWPPRLTGICRLDYRVPRLAIGVEEVPAHRIQMHEHRLLRRLRVSA